MELFNELNEDRENEIEDFLTFIPIYESKRRFRSLRSFLRKNQRFIRNKVCMEAGAGRGLFSQELLELGAKKVYAVERAGIMYGLLEERFAGEKRVQLVNEDVGVYQPEEKIDLLFHEFYGSLILDESMLCLRELEFKPDLILPDGGRLWAMPLNEAEIRERDEVYEARWKELLGGALISDIFEWHRFQPQWEVFSWDIYDPRRSFDFTLPENCDWIAFCGEVCHQQKGVLKMWWTHNWPIIYTPVLGKSFTLRFEYLGEGYTGVYFEWKG